MYKYGKTTYSNYNGFDFKKYQAYKRSQNGYKGHIIAFVVTIAIWFILDYIFYPAYNIRSVDSIFFMGFILGIFGVLDMILTLSFNRLVKLIVGILVVGFAATTVLSFLGSPFFLASQYQQQINMVELTNFSEDFQEISLDQIPLVDKEVAIRLGDKKMGEVSGLGSQFYVDNEYTLISSNDDLYRVASLEHQDFIKWWQNSDNGVPGYIKVNVTDQNDVELVLLDEGIKYTPSAYFNNNLYRHVRFKYRTELLNDYSFEIDDNGKPYWVISTYSPEVGFFGGPSATGVIICDPVSGEMEKYGMDEIPEWVDRVQPSQFAWEQVDNWGYYVHGYINTMFGQKDMLQTTEGYNYVNIDGQTHIFTGITSVGADRSIVGFALINLKTKDAKFYKIGGADEYSAMASAEGQVQHLNYTSTFPILLNIAKQPTYFIPLKDDAGLVKMYSFVNVTNYSIVGVGESLEEAQADYIKKLAGSGSNEVDPSAGLITVKGEVSFIQTAILDGNSLYYIQLLGDEKLYVLPLSYSNELPLTKIGDNVEMSFVETDKDNSSIVPITFDSLEYKY